MLFRTTSSRSRLDRVKMDKTVYLKLHKYTSNVVPWAEYLVFIIHRTKFRIKTKSLLALQLYNRDHLDRLTFYI